jgi:hypothetical protein
LELLAENSETDLEFFVCDYSDAFFIVPNHPEERRFFAVSFRGKIYVFHRTTQGSRGAPLTWARIAALLGRLIQALVGAKMGRISTYVDDPIMPCVGTEAQRTRTIALAICALAALDLPLSLKKASRSKDQKWTSSMFTTLPGGAGLKVRIKDEIVQDIKEDLVKIAAENMIPKKLLASHVGRLSHVGSVISFIRPFLAELYAALYAGETAYVWRKQIQHAIDWIQAFMSDEGLCLSRTYKVSTYLGKGPAVEINMDASPSGLGAYLAVNGVILEFFRSAITVEESDILGMVIGCSSSQQAAEALVALVALRQWKEFWVAEGTTLRVKSDSVAALILVVKLKTAGQACGIIAREVALELSRCPWPPMAAEHIPGLANGICDNLSRDSSPSPCDGLPPALELATEITPPRRNADYFRTMKSPTYGQGGRLRTSEHGNKRSRGSNASSSGSSFINIPALRH